ncbi:putative hydrolase of the HAD superfamily [Kribbella sp. VKM Ac-2527]|uniref:Putative hydrolase of the HAD superfamily n=1 Tax=Kribbella caucasensis TaxID=2512215 RepID=A0A4R6KMC0_9ACTN|nr:HAD-IA family hydrolase [Kribbella sp. VKM Ac-2527]TDO52728.1 putative hydrolase of the HAD superfamily [Kribbella sp. VKM Ac-2527]
MTIEAVLFDADGVIQRPTVDWRTTLESFVRPDQSAEEFVLDLMESEVPGLSGKGDFRVAVADVLARWESTAPMETVLDLWHRFEAEPAVVAIIAELRAAGIGCHLATNQHAYRRAIMQDERGYRDWFDQTFYSCDLGVAKPDTAYFKSILTALDKPASSVLFIDDKAANIEGARAVGLQAAQYDLDEGIPALRTLLATHGLPPTP